VTDIPASLADLDDQPAYNPADPLAILRDASKIRDPDMRAGHIAGAVRLMAREGADSAAMASARSCVQRQRLLPVALFDAAAAEGRTQAEGGEDESANQNQATALVSLAREHYRMVRSTDGRHYAVELTGPNIAIALGRSGQFGAHLVRLYLEREGRAPSDQAERMAVKILGAYLAEQEPEPVHLRLARAGNEVVLDLGTRDGRCAIVSTNGWRVEERSPVLFRRGAGSPLPEPERGHDGLSRLRQLINVNDAQFRLGVAWLVSVLIPGIPHPILTPRGEQGSAKTTLARIFQALIDPSALEPGALPGDEQDFAVRMHGAYIQCFDNASVIPPWLSDALCRAATGATYAARKLYSDDDLAILQYLRPIVLTTIDAGTLSGDLVERQLPLDLDRIKPGGRKTERAVIGDNADEKPGLFDELEQARPVILGSLLDLVSAVLANITSVHPAELPRMADFARILAALDKAMGWETFSQYSEAVNSETGALVEGNPFAVRLVEFMADRQEWTGTATALRDALTAMLPDPDHPPKGWPADPTRTGGLLKRMAPSLRVHGIEAEFDREGKSRTRTYKVAKIASAASAASATYPDLREQADAKADANGQADAASVPRRTLRTLADAEISASVRHVSTGRGAVFGQADAADASSTKVFGAQGAQVTERHAPLACAAGCGTALDPSLTAAGIDTHPGCSAA
jgi:hypothetical protein